MTQKMVGSVDQRTDPYINRVARLRCSRGRFPRPVVSIVVIVVVERIIRIIIVVGWEVIGDKKHGGEKYSKTSGSPALCASNASLARYSLLRKKAGQISTQHHFAKNVVPCENNDLIRLSDTGISRKLSSRAQAWRDTRC